MPTPETDPTPEPEWMKAHHDGYEASMPKGVRAGDLWSSSKEAHRAGIRAVWEASLAAAADLVREGAPPTNSELSMPDGDGPFTDPGMAAYIEGFRDAWLTLNAERVRLDRQKDYS